MSGFDVQALVSRILKSDKRAVARAISLIEDETESGKELLQAIYGSTGKAFRIGITGPPGAGKSTITGKLTRQFVAAGKSVGIIAVDPSSPYTGGAILGDRIRMSDLANEANVFIRSMASRGSLGGLAAATMEACDVLDAAGYDIILIETVGVGQSELDIARSTDCTVVVLVPESGDGIQAMKAGLMEIADLFVINKSDREGAAKMAVELELMIHMRQSDTPEPPVLKTTATQNSGIVEVHDRLEQFKRDSQSSGLLQERRKKRAGNRLREMLAAALHQLFIDTVGNEELEQALLRLAELTSSPYEELENLMNSFMEKYHGKTD